MPRDREVIASVYQHGMLNSKQIEYIHFRENKNSKVIALRRLKKMVDFGYLKQHWFGWNQFGTMQHFTITNKGAMIVALSLDLDPKDVKVYEKHDIRNVEHTIMIGNFHIGLLKSGFEVENFTSDYLNRFEFAHKLEKFILEPDGRGIMHGRKSYPFLLEIDRGGMNYDEFKNKITKYESFYLSRHYRKEFEQFPLIVIATSNENRIKRLKQEIEKERKTEINYLLTTFNQMDKLNEPVFNLAGYEGLVAL